MYIIKSTCFYVILAALYNETAESIDEIHFIDFDFKLGLYSLVTAWLYRNMSS